MRPVKIEILSASIWETRRSAEGLGLLSVERNVFEGGTGKHEVRLRLTGMGGERAREAAGKVFERPPDLVIATGFAGSLRENIRPGDLVLDIARSDSSQAEALTQAAE